MALAASFLAYLLSLSDKEVFQILLLSSQCRQLISIECILNSILSVLDKLSSRKRAYALAADASCTTCLSLAVDACCSTNLSLAVDACCIPLVCL
jgi:hypothetical protein